MNVDSMASVRLDIQRNSSGIREQLLRYCVVVDDSGAIRAAERDICVACDYLLGCRLALAVQ